MKPLKALSFLSCLLCCPAQWLKSISKGEPTAQLAVQRSPDMGCGKFSEIGFASKHFQLFMGHNPSFPFSGVLRDACSGGCVQCCLQCCGLNLCMVNSWASGRVVDKRPSNSGIHMHCKLFSQQKFSSQNALGFKFKMSLKNLKASLFAFCPALVNTTHSCKPLSPHTDRRESNRKKALGLR